MTIKEKKIVLVAGHYLSYDTDEAILNGYYTLQDVSDDHPDEFASDFVMVWAPLGTLSVAYLLSVINYGIINLDEFLEEYKREML